MAKLIVTPEDGLPVTHDFDASEGDVITIGRLPDNQVQIDDASISSHHAQISKAGGAWVFKDLNSTNGSRHNGEQVTEVRLEHGDELRLGKIRVRFESVASAADAKSLPEVGKVAVALADSSERPSDFQNASPFHRKAQSKDTLGRATLAVAALAFLTFLAAAVQLLLVKPPQ